MLRKLGRHLKSLFRGTGLVIMAAVITSPLAYAGVMEAYNQRGYFAVGGEWMMTVMVFSLVLSQISKRGKRWPSRQR